MSIDLLITKFSIVVEEQKEAVRQRRSRKQIEELLQLFSKSPCSVKEFCKEQGISPANFHKWKGRYKVGPVAKQKPSGFASIDVTRPPLPGLFAEVNGIRIYQPVSASFLKELLL